MPERMPLSGREYAAMLSLFAAVSHYSELFPVLRKRAESVDAWDEMQEISTAAQAVIDKLFQTVPLKKLKQVSAELSHVQLYIKIEPPGCVRTMNTAGFSYIPTKTVNDLLQYICDHECLMCDKSAVEARKCPYREMIENCLPHKVDAKDSANCKFSDMMLGLEEAE